MTTICDPEYVRARRQADSHETRFGHPHLGTCPAYYRKHLRPRVRIGVLRDPVQPIRIEPAVHTPPPRQRHDWRNSALWAASCVAVVASFAVVGW